MSPVTALTAQPDPSLGGHGEHLLVLGLAWMIAVLAWEISLKGTARAQLLALTTTGFSGCIHLLVVPEHFGENWIYGAFFLMVGLAQLAWCWAYRRRPSARLLNFGGSVSATIVLLWIETRFVGSGFGPLTAGTEGIGWHDVVATVLESVLVAMALQARALPSHSKPWSTSVVAHGAGRTGMAGPGGAHRD